MRREEWNFFSGFPWAGMSFGKRSRFFESGEIRLALLSLLSEGPKHGYQLMKEISERSGGVYKASAGSVYPTLQQLEDEGLVEVTPDSGRRVYSLTDAGRAELASDPETVRRIWERAERCEDWSQWVGPDSLAVWGPLTDLVKSGLRAAGRANARHQGTERVRDILDRARHELDSI